MGDYLDIVYLVCTTHLPTAYACPAEDVAISRMSELTGTDRWTHIFFHLLKPSSRWALPVIDRRCAVYTTEIGKLNYYFCTLLPRSARV